MAHSRLYPNWEQINSFKQPLTEGERSFIKFLDDNLPKDEKWNSALDKLEDYHGWLIFVQPYLNGTK